MTDMYVVMGRHEDEAVWRPAMTGVRNNQVRAWSDEKSAKRSLVQARHLFDECKIIKVAV